MIRKLYLASVVAGALMILGFIGHADAADGELSSLRVPVCFTDNMVLQRSHPVTVWGDAAPGSEITIGFGGQTAKTKADRHGRWRTQLDSMPASAEGRTLTIR